MPVISRKAREAQGIEAVSFCPVMGGLKNRREAVEIRGILNENPQDSGQKIQAESPVRPEGPDAPGILKIFRGLLPFTGRFSIIKLTTGR
jgi:hypothetical protein